MIGGQTKLDSLIIRNIREDIVFSKRSNITQEFGRIIWCAVVCSRKSIQKEKYCKHYHRSMESAWKCSKKLQKEFYNEKDSD